MELKKLIKEHHKAMIEKGFYPDGEEKNLGEMLMLMISELSEILEADRNHSYTDLKKVTHNPLLLYNFSQWKWNFEACVKDTFEDEVADVFLRLFDFCGYMKIKLEEPGIKPEILPVKNVGENLLVLTDHVVSIRFVDYDSWAQTLYYSLQCFAITYDVDYEKHILAKMEYNKTRPIKHGKLY